MKKEGREKGGKEGKRRREEKGREGRRREGRNKERTSEATPWLCPGERVGSSWVWQLKGLSWSL